MKLFVLIIILIFSNHLFSFSLQLGAGGLTPHFSTKKKNYCNQWNNTGIIANKSYYIRLMGEKVGMTYLRGNDSICSDIEGLFFHYVYSRTDWIETGVTLGGYAFNQQNWLDYAQTTPSGIAAPQAVQIDYFGRPLVPVLAIDIAVHLIRNDNWSIKLNNLFTPIIFNHSLSYEYRF